MATTKKSTKADAPLSYAASELKWRTESDLRTLQEAAAIERDPKRMKAAQEMAKQKLVELASVVGDQD